MEGKQPVILVVAVETEKLRWFVAGIEMDGTEIPLLVSEEGNLSPYLEAEGEEQVSFLRHRFCGVLQRGSDRLWGRQRKPCQIVFIFDGPLIQAPSNLAERVAEHMVLWLSNPPVAFFRCNHGFSRHQSDMECLAGEIDASLHAVLGKALSRLASTMQRREEWELAPTKSKC